MAQAAAGGPVMKIDRSPKHEGPLNVIQLGWAGWPLLHRMSLSYPVAPTDEQKQRMETLIHAFSNLYPCTNCAEDLRQKIKEHPPKLDTRNDFAIWLCE